MQNSLFVACVQLSCSNDEFANISEITELIGEAKGIGCELVVLPEMVNLIRPEKIRERIVTESESLSLQLLRQQALLRRVWLHVGSLALRDGVRFVNRSILINPNGEIYARYDKVHLFSANLGAAGTFREADLYRQGNKMVIARTGWGNYGFSICFDVRFGSMYRAMARSGADVIAVPSAFNYQTGSAHWEVLLRARAIETGCYILAPAQSGLMDGREFWGHSMIVSPWGQIISEARTTNPEVISARLYRKDILDARKRLPTQLWQNREPVLEVTGDSAGN